MIYHAIHVGIGGVHENFMVYGKFNLGACFNEEYLFESLGHGAHWRDPCWPNAHGIVTRSFDPRIPWIMDFFDSLHKRTMRGCRIGNLNLELGFNTRLRIMEKKRNQH